MKALAITPEGEVTECDSSLQEVYKVVGTQMLDHASCMSRVFADYPNLRFKLWVDDMGLHKQLPVNMLATGMYAAGSPIVGSAVLWATDPNTGETVDLPEQLITELKG